MNTNPWEAILVNEYRVWDREPPAGILKALRDDPPFPLVTPHIQSILREAVEELSDGENTVLFDDHGVPSVMMRFSMLRTCDLLQDTSNPSPHPAFRLGRRILPEIWVGKYLASLWQGYPASLPLAQPHRCLRFDDAVQSARKKGNGWQLMPYQVHTALALSSLYQRTLPGGNNEKGHDFFCKDEKGELLGDLYLVRTGSGVPRWSHNGKPSGVWDLNGNLNEWTTGFRLMNGEVQVEEMHSLCYDSATWEENSPAWKALDASCRPVSPGSDDTLHYESCPEGIRLILGPGNHEIGNCAFQAVTLGEGVVPCDEMKLWGLYPPDPDEKAVLGWRWILPQGETLPLSGGAYLALDHAGIFFTGITKSRHADYTLGGMRLIWIDPRYLKEEGEDE